MLRSIILEFLCINAATIKKAELDKSDGTSISFETNSLPVLLPYRFFINFLNRNTCIKRFKHNFSMISSNIVFDYFSIPSVLMAAKIIPDLICADGILISILELTNSLSLIKTGRHPLVVLIDAFILLNGSDILFIGLAKEIYHL